MSKKNKNKEQQSTAQSEAKEAQQAQEAQQSQAKAEESATEEKEKEAEENSEKEEPAKPELTPEEQIKKLTDELAKQKNDYLFLMAEFDNYRKRTLKEKGELIKTAASRCMEELLPVVDDFERAIKANADVDDAKSVKEGVELIYNKFVKYLEKQQVLPIESTGKDFDADTQEAVTTFPAQTDDQKGKVIDTVLKGYTINGHVLRHAKVVVGK